MRVRKLWLRAEESKAQQQTGVIHCITNLPDVVASTIIAGVFSWARGGKHTNLTCACWVSCLKQVFGTNTACYEQAVCPPTAWGCRLLRFSSSGWGVCHISIKLPAAHHTHHKTNASGKQTTHPATPLPRARCADTTCQYMTQRCRQLPAGRLRARSGAAL